MSKGEQMSAKIEQVSEEERTCEVSEREQLRGREYS